MAIISDEREGLNHKNPFVKAFSQAVSKMIAPYVLAEQEKLNYLGHAITSGRTGHMIEHLLLLMNRAAVEDFGFILPPAPDLGAGGLAGGFRRHCVLPRLFIIARLIILSTLPCCLIRASLWPMRY